MLLKAYMESPAGQLIRMTFDLEFALNAGVTISLHDISYPEFLLLRILTQERNRFAEDLMKKRNGG